MIVGSGSEGGGGDRRMMIERESEELGSTDDLNTKASPTAELGKRAGQYLSLLSFTWPAAMSREGVRSGRRGLWA